MSEQVVNPQDLIRLDHIKKMKDIFKEPGQVGWSQESLKKLDLLYTIAFAEDSIDPIGWVDSFNRSNPNILAVGAETSRIGKILTMAEIYMKQKQQKIQKRDDFNRPKL